MDGLERSLADSLNFGILQVNKLYHQLARFFYTYPVTVFLTGISVITYICIQVNYLVQLLSIIFYFIEILSRFVFNWIYPAAVFSLAVVFSMRFLPKGLAEKVNRFERDSRPPVLVVSAVIACIIAGQLTLICLPPIVNFMAVPFVSDPTSLLTILVMFTSLIYGGYYLIVVAQVGTPQTRYAVAQQQDMEDRGDENTCVVCLVNPKAILIKPCRHFCVCTDCIRRLVECPVCKAGMLDYERIYST